MRNFNINTILVITTIGDFGDAKSMARHLVKQKLCACANIIPKCYSIYSWEDKIEEAEEYLLLIKTAKEKYQALEQAIKSKHKYEVPETISIDITDGLPEYLNWINSIVRE